MAKRFLTVAEAAELTDTPVRTMRRWCKTGAIPAIPGPCAGRGSSPYKIPVGVLRDRADLLGYATSREDALEGY